MSPGWLIFSLTFSLLIAAGALRKKCVVEDKETLRCYYFPERISEEISRVRVMDFIGPNENMVINSSDFSTEGWGHVKYLEISNSLKYSDLNFTTKTFSNLKMLEELQLHLDHFVLDPDTFVGLNLVRSLDVSDCFRVSFDGLLQSLNGTDKLPGLTKLTVSRLNRYHPPNIIDERFGKSLQQKNLTYIDMSNSEITEFYFVVFDYLRYLNFINVSSATFGDMFKETFNFSHLKGIVFDLSHTILPDRMRPPPGKVSVSNVVVKHLTLHSFFLIALQDAKIVNVSSIVPATSSIWLKNITVIIHVDKPVFIQRIIAKHNNLKYLDIHIDSFRNSCIACRLDKIDLSYNGLQFINPSLLSVFAPKVKTLNLSFNQLFEMSKNNASIFATLLKRLAQLQFVSLSNNNLETIPDNMFGDNLALEIIDISGNKLSQVTFLMTHLNKLRILDLRHNFIRVLDEMSLNHLDSILENTGRNETQTSVLFSFNPLSCSGCDSKSFIIWVLKTPLVNIASQNLQCMSEDGDLSIIDEDSVHAVQSICLRNTIIVVSSVSSACLIVIFIAVGSRLYKYWKRIRVLKKRNMVIDLLQNGEGQFEFAAFLTYSTENEEFVQTYILDELNKNLQRKTEIRRELICTGEHFRIGHSIFEEALQCFERASVIIFVFSNDFRLTAESHFIVDQVLGSEKPVIIMLQCRVDEHNEEEEHVSGRVRILCHESTQIQWNVEDGQFTLSTTWDEVCNIILDHSARNF